MHQDFSGWSLEDWSLAHELLELRFHLWPTIENVDQARLSDKIQPIKYYRGKGIFSRPNKIIFHEYISPATIEGVTIKRDAKKGTITYQYSLTKGGVIEVEAISYSSKLW